MSPSPLTPPQIDELKLLLEKQLARIMRSVEMSDAASRPVELDQTAVGRLSRMDSLQNQGLAKNLRDREEATLSLVRGALARIEAGTYGVCESCGDPIAFGRLTIMPEASRCAGCG